MTQRYSHFAASPLCAISWTFEGHGYLQIGASRGAPDQLPAFPKIAVSGPYDTPQTSWSSHGFHAMTLALYPDAFASLTGIAPGDCANQTLPAEDLLAPDLLQLVLDVAQLGDARKGFDLIEEGLGPIWESCRPGNPVFGAFLDDWIRSLAVRAAFSGIGKSTRQTERRIRAWTGQSLRRLSTHAKGETAFEYAVNARTDGKLSLADMAVDLGYADQSHMGRQVKDITGFSPADFLRRYDDDECFWCFRLMGERFQTAAPEPDFRNRAAATRSVSKPTS